MAAFASAGLSSSSADSATNRCASTSPGSISRARAAAAAEAAGSSSASARARPMWAGAQSGVGLHGDAERLHRLARLVLLEEEPAPRRVHGRVVLDRVRRVAVERVGRPRLVERVRRAGRAQQPVGGDAAARRVDERHQHARGIARAAELAIQQAQLQRRLAEGTARGGRLQQRQRLVVLPAVDREAAEDRGGRRVARTAPARQRLRVGPLAVGDRRGRRLRERQLGRDPRLLGLRLRGSRLRRPGPRRLRLAAWPASPRAAPESLGRHRRHEGRERDHRQKRDDARCTHDVFCHYTRTLRGQPSAAPSAVNGSGLPAVLDS